MKIGIYTTNMYPNIQLNLNIDISYSSGDMDSQTLKLDIGCVIPLMVVIYI